MSAGFSRWTAAAADEPIEWTLTTREVLFVLEGSARIEIEGGPTLELKPGDVASLPAGAKTTWHLTRPFKEFWALAE